MFTFVCKPDGGEPFKVEAASRAIAAWEQAPGSKGRSVSALSENMRMSELVDLAWFAADRAGKTGLDIKTWREQVDINVVPGEDDDEDEAGPT